MNRRITVLRILVLALEELVTRGEPLHRARLMNLACVYGRGIDVEEWELEPFFEEPIISAVVKGTT